MHCGAPLPAIELASGKSLQCRRLLRVAADGRYRCVGWRPTICGLAEECKGALHVAYLQQRASGNQGMGKGKNKQIMRAKGHPFRLL